MIDVKTLRLITQNGLQSFSAGHMLDGIAALRTLLPYCTAESIAFAEAESLERNYHYMLAFLRKGGDDHERGDVQAKLQRQGAALLEYTSRAIRINIGSDRYGKAWLKLKESFGPDVQDNVLEAFRTSPFKGEPEGERQDDLFDLLWTSPLWTPQDTALWYDFFLGQRDMVQQHLAGALFLSAWEYFDAEKIQLLGLLADSGCRRTGITAASYLLLLRLRHKGLAPMLPALPACLLTKRGRRLIAQVQYEMLLMLVSEKDMKQELEEIGEFTHSIVTGKQTLDMAGFKTLIETRGRHLRNRLQRGLDPNLSKTALLRTCKYLDRVAHWFLPFDKNHPLFQSVMIDEKGNEKQNISTLVDFILDCDIDKTATLYLVANDKDFSKAVQQLDDQELPDLKNAVIPEYTFRFIMQDLYRFFGHSPLHAQLANPFRDELTLLDFPELAGLFSAEDCIKCCGLMSELGRNKQALEALNSLIEREGATVPALILKGRVLIDLKRYAEAQGSLRNAEILEPDNIDALRLLSECFAAQHRFEEELEYLRKLAEVAPEKDICRRLLPTTMLKAGHPEEALQLLFKLDYETEKDDPAIISGIADTALALGKLDIAERYTQKEMELLDLTSPARTSPSGGKPDREPWKATLRMGHIRMLQGDWKGSIGHYEQFVNAYCKETGKDIKAALSMLDKEWAKGKSQEAMGKDLLLVRDILQAGAEQGAKESASETA